MPCPDSTLSAGPTIKQKKSQKRSIRRRVKRDACSGVLERLAQYEELEEDEFLLFQCGEMVGSESESAARVRRCREKKTLQCNTDVTPLLRECNTDIEKEKEKDIDKNSCPEQDSGTQPKVEEGPAAVEGLKHPEIDAVLMFLTAVLSLHKRIKDGSEWL